MDIFKKCYDYTIVRDAKEAGIYPYFHALESRQDVEVVMEGKRRIMLGSNNYLGLTVNEDVYGRLTVDDVDGILAKYAD